MGGKLMVNCSINWVTPRVNMFDMNLCYDRMNVFVFWCRINRCPLEVWFRLLGNINLNSFYVVVKYAGLLSLRRTSDFCLIVVINLVFLRIISQLIL